VGGLSKVSQLILETGGGRKLDLRRPPFLDGNSPACRGKFPSKKKRKRAFHYCKLWVAASAL